MVTRKKNGLEWFLGLFAEVRGGEGLTSLLLMLNIFLILTSYYIIKPVREALILSSNNGAEIKSYLAALMPFLLLIIIPAYSRLADRFPRGRLIAVVTSIFIANLVIFYVLSFQFSEAKWLGPLFFVWVGIFNLMVVAQFWSFANDVYTPEQGKRLFAIVGFGASSGAFVGSKVAGLLIEPLGVFQILLVAAGILLLCIGLTLLVNRLSKRQVADRAGDAGTTGDAQEEALEEGSGFALVLRNRYLLLIGVLLLLLNLVNTTGEFILGSMVTAWASDQGATEAATKILIGKFYAEFFAYVNLAGMLIQLFLVSRIIKYIGVRIALLILPVIALGSYTLFAFFPVLGLLRVLKSAENATDYSLHNTLRNGVLYLPTTRAEKYKAKQAVDTFFVRAGDVLSALVVFAGVNLLDLSVRGFAVFNVALALVWIAVAFVIGRQFEELMAKKEESESPSGATGEV